MANGFGSLYVGSSGLRGAQNAINTTANNLANLNTVGYVREQVIFADETYNRIKDVTTRTNMQQNGLGVSIGDVVHIRDIFLDKAYRLEEGRSSFYNTSYEVVEQVEDFLQELNGMEFKESIQELWQSFQEYEKEPENSTNQNLVIEKTELFLTRCDSLYSDLISYQDNLNEQIKDSIDNINKLARDIYKLNSEIQKVESAKLETAMTVRDIRDAKIDELATYGKIRVEEDATGFAFITFENIELVGTDRAYEIELRKDDHTGFYTPYWKHLSDKRVGRYQDVFNLDAVISPEYDSDIGKVKALMLSRGSEYGTDEYLNGDDNDGTPYKELKKSSIMEVQSEISVLFRKIVLTVNNHFSPLKESNLDTITGTLDDGTTATFTYDNGTVTYNHIDKNGNEDIFVFKDEDAYLDRVDGKVGKTYRKANSILILDEENASYGIDNELPPRELFVRYGSDRYTKLTAADGKVYYVYNGERVDNPSTHYSLSRVEVNAEIRNKAGLMPCYTKNGAVNRDLSAQLAQAWEVKDMIIGPDDTIPCNISAFYDKIVGRTANRGSAYHSAGLTLERSAAALDKKRQEVIGVSSDEELTKMIKYQSAYNASSRFMSVISEMTELIVTQLR
ncbi:flagellar hook-associated protein FlgK [Lachnobacterium bovis]|uniref:Flagellar hook-associated protein 1 n=1 Tax=Lachnobacterium bovis TaxID=140626 RepID=A0A1H9SDW1_9FIRM|nr:flagellar basal body protein [Lachnobacterium bovis]SER83167.1 flagellar hook-associated protein 1 FlgK [Lachnobacterium bovis]